ncbi:Peroxisomal membrane signal receptor PTS1 [Elasticomyces elasticus]|nr:Peroxisomal membrane signal receptor PTS1 [Elasticomyces elasticus]
MSFLGGPECSTGANPLAQFQKQSSADTSLQRDRLTQRPPQLNGFRNQQLPDDAQFQEFQQQGPGFNEQLPQDANYQQQLFLLEQQQQQQARAGGGDGWAGELAQQPPTFSPEQFAQQQGRNGAFSPQDFSNFRQQQMSPASRQAQTPVPQQQSLYQRPPMYGSTFGGSGFGMQRPMMFQPQQPMYGQQPQEQYQGKGKGRIQELSDTDWEEQFKELSTVDKEGELDQLDADAEQAIEAELNQMDRYATPFPLDLASCDPALTLHCGVGGQHGNKMVRDAGFGEFEDIWQGYQAEANVARDMLGDEGHMGEYDEWKDFDGMSHDFDGLRTFENRGPESSNYLFEENNLFDDVPNAFEEGLKIMREGGSLSLAALAFEAAVQKQPEMVEAWVALGSAQAQNEKESPAIRAMEQALKLDSNNLDALMGLSVSYTNEGYDSLAYRTLERWVSVKYPQLGLTPQGLDEAAQAEEEMGFTNRHQLHEKVTALFLEAAQLNPEGMDVDIDVQVGLGVLFYGSEDYDKAVDCFNAALDSAETGTMKREGEEHLLWNRLGATLANSGRSEEAIEAYSRALELRSNFVRARYNLGVSCINLGVLEQAAGHLLGALSMHRVIEREGRMKAAELLRDGNGNAVDDREVEGLLQQNQSTNLYDTLRRVFTQMDRRDLSEGEESESVSQPQVYAKVLRGDIVSDAENAKARWAIPNEAGGFDFADSVSPPQKSLRRLSADILSGGGGSVVGTEEAQTKVRYEAGESDSAELSPAHLSFQEASSDIRCWGTDDHGETVHGSDAPVVQGEGIPAAATTDQQMAEKTLVDELAELTERTRGLRYHVYESQASHTQIPESVVKEEGMKQFRTMGEGAEGILDQDEIEWKQVIARNPAWLAETWGSAETTLVQENDGNPQHMKDEVVRRDRENLPHLMQATGGEITSAIFDDWLASSHDEASRQQKAGSDDSKAVELSEEALVHNAVVGTDDFVASEGETARVAESSHQLLGNIDSNKEVGDSWQNIERAQQISKLITDMGASFEAATIEIEEKHKQSRAANERVSDIIGQLIRIGRHDLETEQKLIEFQARWLVLHEESDAVNTALKAHVDSLRNIVDSEQDLQHWAKDFESLRARFVGAGQALLDLELARVATFQQMLDRFQFEPLSVTEQAGLQKLEEEHGASDVVDGRDMVALEEKMAELEKKNNVLEQSHARLQEEHEFRKSMMKSLRTLGETVASCAAQVEQCVEARSGVKVMLLDAPKEKKEEYNVLFADNMAFVQTHQVNQQTMSELRDAHSMIESPQGLELWTSRFEKFRPVYAASSQALLDHTLLLQNIIVPVLEGQQSEHPEPQVGEQSEKPELSVDSVGNVADAYAVDDEALSLEYITNFAQENLRSAQDASDMDKSMQMQANQEASLLRRTVTLLTDAGEYTDEMQRAYEAGVKGAEELIASHDEYLGALHAHIETLRDLESRQDMADWEMEMRDIIGKIHLSSVEFTDGTMLMDQQLQKMSGLSDAELIDLIGVTANVDVAQEFRRWYSATSGREIDFDTVDTKMNEWLMKRIVKYMGDLGVMKIEVQAKNAVHLQEYMKLIDDLDRIGTSGKVTAAIKKELQEQLEESRKPAVAHERLYEEAHTLVESGQSTAGVLLRLREIVRRVERLEEIIERGSFDMVERLREIRRRESKL